MLSEEPFANHRLDMTDEKDDYTIYDYVSQHFCIKIAETMTCHNCCAKKSPNVFNNFSFILTLEEISQNGKRMRSISHEKMNHLGKSCVKMMDFMENMYETTELSDVICDECTKSRSTAIKSNFEKKTVLKSPMHIRISLQRSNYNI